MKHYIIHVTTCLLFWPTLQYQNRKTYLYFFIKKTKRLEVTSQLVVRSDTCTRKRLFENMLARHTEVRNLRHRSLLKREKILRFYMWLCTIGYSFCRNRPRLVIVNRESRFRIKRFTMGDEELHVGCNGANVIFSSSTHLYANHVA